MTTAFLTPLETRQWAKDDWELTQRLVLLDRGNTYVAEPGDRTDFASINALKELASLLSIVGGVATIFTQWTAGWSWVTPACDAFVLTLLTLYAMLAGEGNAAATIHDQLYRLAQVSRAKADAIFHRALLAEKVHPIKARIMWMGVRLWGWRHYGK